MVKPFIRQRQKMENRIKESKKRDHLFYFPFLAGGISLVLAVVVLWPKINTYHALNKEYRQEISEVTKVYGRWDEISQRENYYRKIYSNLQEISQKVGNPGSNIDYMKIFIDQSRSNRVRIISYKKEKDRSLPDRREIYFQLIFEGHYKEIANYLNYLENTYPIINIDTISISPKLTGYRENILLKVVMKGKIIFLT